MSSVYVRYPTVEAEFKPEPANTVLAGPTSGGNAVPTFRALVAGDLPTITGFVKTDGSTPLTANWNAGSFQITANGVQLGSAANSIAALTTIGTSGNTLTFTGQDFVLGNATRGTLQIQSSGTSGASNIAELQLTSAVGGGDAYINLNQGANNWVFGAHTDNTFQIGTGNALGTPILTLTTGGSATFSGTIAASNLSGTNTGDQTITLTSDITGSGIGSFATTVAKIKGTTVSGTTGTTNVVFSTAPTIAGGSITALTGLAIRDTSAAFDVTLAGTSSTTLTAGRTLTLDTNNVSSTLKMGANLTVTGATTVNGTFSGTSSGTNTGDITLAAVGSSPNANAATLAAQVLNLELADATHPGICGTSTQSFGGQKNFVSGTFGGNSTLQAFSTRSGVFQVQTSSANRVSAFINENNTSGANVVVGLNTSAAGNYGFPNSGNALGFITWAGANNATGAYSQSANIAVTAGSTWTSTNFETNYALALVPSASTSATTVHAISSAGAHTLGASSTTPQHVLNTSLATNGAGILTLSNGPSGTTGNPTGYIQITINGSTRNIPFW